MKQYKVIFIDWDDTIGDFQGSAQAAQREIFEKYNLAEFFSTYENYYALYHEHNVQLWEQYGRGEISKEYLHLDRFLWPICHVMSIPTPKQGPLVTLAERMGEDFLQFTNKYFRLLPGTAELVRYLAGKYPLTVVSNGFVEVQYYKIEHSGLKDCFEHVVLSEEVGVQKPQPEIYRVAFEKAKASYLQQTGQELRLEDVLMIGDSYSSDIQGAKNAGIDQLWIQPLSPVPSPHGGERGDSEQSATYIVHSLAEIYDIV